MRAELPVCAAPCCFTVTSCSRLLPAGTFAVVSIMIGGVTERLAPATAANSTNATEDVDAAAARVRVACSLTLLTGIFQVRVKPVGGAREAD